MKRWDAIIERFPEGNIKGAEIGVYKAKMSQHLLNSIPNLELYVIDRWSEYTVKEKLGDKRSPMVYLKKDTWKKIHKKVIKIQKKYKNMHIIRQDSGKASMKFKDNYFDFVFIDGDHSYKGVLKDIKSWYPKVKTGGYLSGHDYQRKTVKKAIEKVFSINEIGLDYDRTWFIKKNG
jgi:hypothetical protein